MPTTEYSGCTDCCETTCGDCDPLPPTTLTVAISGATCSDANTSTNVTWVSANNRWEGTVSIAGVTLAVTVRCEVDLGTGYVISIDYISPLSGTFGVTDPITATCSPFEASQVSISLFYQDAIQTACGGTSDTATFTATE